MDKDVKKSSCFIFTWITCATIENALEKAIFVASCSPLHLKHRWYLIYCTLHYYIISILPEQAGIKWMSLLAIVGCCFLAKTTPTLQLIPRKTHWEKKEANNNYIVRLSCFVILASTFFQIYLKAVETYFRAQCPASSLTNTIILMLQVFLRRPCLLQPHFVARRKRLVSHFLI